MNNKYMDIALEEAYKAFSKNEVPVGAVIVKNGEILAKSHNLKAKTSNIMNHAEIIALNDASNKNNDWRLIDCEMYITLEPCPMCASAIQQSRIKKVYIGTRSNLNSNLEIIDKIFKNDEFYHKVDYEFINDKRCSIILSDFFANKR